MTNLVRTVSTLIACGLVSSVSGCGSEPDAAAVASKEQCIVEVSRKLLACGEEKECEQGVARYAGYCNNEAPGSQMDICRGGRYYFEQPLAELAGA